MAHAFPVKDIALQAGVSVATVDRVLHGRPGVRALTVRRIQQAIGELERQSAQVGLSGRRLLLDLVMESPLRFSDAVRSALESEMPQLRPAVFRCRHHVAEVRSVEETVTILEGIGRRGSNGVLLKAQDVPEISAAARRLGEAGIPVVTVATDLPHSGRLGYVGIDNRAAGETAAYLVGAWLGPQPAGVLVSLSSNRFRGEEEREIGFRRALRAWHPQLEIVEISEGHGLDLDTGAQVRRVLQASPRIAGVYSIGGGNTAIIRAFEELGRPCRVFLGHDLDADNLNLLRRRRIHAVLYHDLRHDVRSACQQVMRAHGLLPRGTQPSPSNVQVVTPWNIPQDANGLHG